METWWIPWARTTFSCHNPLAQNNFPQRNRELGLRPCQAEKYRHGILKVRLSGRMSGYRCLAKSKLSPLPTMNAMLYEHWFLMTSKKQLDPTGRSTPSSGTSLEDGGHSGPMKWPFSETTGFVLFTHHLGLGRLERTTPECLAWANSPFASD